MTPEPMLPEQMTPERWREVDGILEAALDLLPQERAAFLRQACADDADLRRQVEALLDAHDQAGGFIEAPPAEEMAELFDNGSHEDLTGQLIGPYRLARELGRGGMGVVYLAGRADDEYEKLVAVKLVWPGPRNDELMRRFRRERQILANLDHPNIARLLDGGRTEQGWPYLVMEYVEGAPITEYCNQRRLSITDRLKLFREVCAAVQHAHQNLVIHRDLKPSNILVTVDGAVKLLDFGIAKLSDPERHDLAAQPTTHALLMTPEYASPEQVRGASITTASDVYSLGVVFYEMLTGASPYRFKDRSLPELMRVVCEQEPEPPSELVRQSPPPAQDFGETKPERLRARLRGDLDQIALTALHKDAQARYRTVEQLGEDIRRHQEGKPILARSATWLYRAGKFVRRYKAGVALVALLALTLLGGIVATAWQAGNAKEQARINRRLAYAGQMALATQDWELANVDRMRELVESYLPRNGEEDLRGFEWHYLWRLLHRNGELLALRHSIEVWAVAFAPDGKLIATGDNDGLARIWDAGTGQLLTTIKADSKHVWAAAFSPDGLRLATAGGDPVVKLWEVGTGRELVAGQGHTQRLTSVAFSPDGKKLATGSRDRTVRLWDAATGQTLITIPLAVSAYQPVAFSPDGRLLATIGEPGAPVKLWDANTGRARGEFKAENESPLAIAFSPDGKMLAAGGTQRTVRLWEVGTGKERSALIGHTGEVRSVAFSPDGQTLASGSADRTMKLWEVATGRERTTFKGHLGGIYSLAFSPDGIRLLTGGNDYTARLWSATATPESISFNSATFAFSADGRQVATTARDRRLQPGELLLSLIDALTGQELARFGRHESGIQCLSFSADGRQLATGGADKAARLWDIATGQELAVCRGHAESIRSVAFSPDGRKLATGSNDRTARVWDTATGRELFRLTGHQNLVISVAFSPDGWRLATGSYDRTARVWDAATGRELAALAGHAKPILALAFSPDGETLATGSADGTVKLWAVATGREVITLNRHAGHVNAVAFSPDGKRLASGGDEGLVRVWDTASGQELIALRGHTDKVASVSFSRDGRTLASGGFDRTVRFWRAATEQEVAARGRQ